MLKSLNQWKWLLLIVLNTHLTSFAFTSAGNHIHILTHLKSITDFRTAPQWVITLRDDKNGQVFNYLYEIKKLNNEWYAGNLSHNVRVTSSTVYWENHATQTNFCSLEGEKLNQTELYVNISGDLTSTGDNVKCQKSAFHQPEP